MNANEVAYYLFYKKKKSRLFVLLSESNQRHNGVTKQIHSYHTLMLIIFL